MNLVKMYSNDSYQSRNVKKKKFNRFCLWALKGLQLRKCFYSEKNRCDNFSNLFAEKPKRFCVARSWAKKIVSRCDT